MGDRIVDGSFYEGENVLNIGRVMRGDNFPLLLNDMLPTGTWDLVITDDKDVEVYSLTNQAPQAIGSGGTFSNNLILDSYWDDDLVGYNFRHVVNASLYSPKGGVRYTYTYTMRTATNSWGVKRAPFSNLCLSVKPTSSG